MDKPMTSAAKNNHSPCIRKLAWLPIPLFLASIAVLWFLDIRAPTGVNRRPWECGWCRCWPVITESMHAEEALQRHAEELRIADTELERFNHVAVDRALQMIELKKQINALLVRAGQEERYPLTFEK